MHSYERLLVIIIIIKLYNEYLTKYHQTKHKITLQHTKVQHKN